MAYLIRSESAEERLTRAFARFLAAAFGFYLLTLIPELREAFRVARTLTAVTAPIVFGTGLALLPASFATDYRRAVRRVAFTITVAYPICTTAWLIAALRGVHLQHDVWPTFFPGLAAMAAVMRLRPWSGTIYSVGVIVLAVTCEHYGRVGNGDPLFPALAFSLAFAFVFISAAMVAWRVGRMVDETQSQALIAARSSAAEIARNGEQQRFAAIIHDDVIVTLLAGSRIPDTAVVAPHARSVVAMLDRIEHEEDAEPLAPPEVITTLAAIAGRVAPHGRWSVSGTHETTGADASATAATYPVDVVRAIGSATAEALRNVLRHSGSDAEFGTHLDLGQHTITVVVHDSGVGFDLTAIPPHRLGLRASIIGRMQSLPGGDARVTSTPGSGTVVTLTWRDPS